jgi:hypothetical protein
MSRAYADLPNHAQETARHKLRRRKADTTVINPVLINPVLKTSATNSMPTLRQQNLNPLPVLNTRMAEMRRVPDTRGLHHAPLDLGGEFFALFDACAEERYFRAERGHCCWVVGVVGLILCGVFVELGCCVRFVDCWYGLKQYYGPEALAEGSVFHAFVFQEPAAPNLAV